MPRRILNRLILAVGLMMVLVLLSSTRATFAVSCSAGANQADHEPGVQCMAGPINPGYLAGPDHIWEEPFPDYYAVYTLTGASDIDHCDCDHPDQSEDRLELQNVSVITWDENGQPTPDGACDRVVDPDGQWIRIYPDC